jgi:hypothetical protein
MNTSQRSDKYTCLMSEYLTYLRRGTQIIDQAKREIEINVTAARILGDSWTEIGEALGMSKQAARQRFGTVVERKQLKGQTTVEEHLHD